MRKIRTKRYCDCQSSIKETVYAYTLSIFWFDDWKGSTLGPITCNETIS